MIAKRHQVDAGDATVSDLQIYYLQHDPASWVNKSTAVLDDAIARYAKIARRSERSRRQRQRLWSTGITTRGNVVRGSVWRMLIAFYTAKSIKEPINHLIEVAQRIGETGDLDQSIDIHRDDEVGRAGGKLQQDDRALEGHGRGVRGDRGRPALRSVQPRSQQDTMAKAFARMTRGIARPGPPGSRQRLAGGERRGPDGGRFGRIREGERAGGFGDRRSDQHDARDEHQRAERGEEHAGAGFERGGNFRFDRSDGDFDPARGGHGKLLVEISHRSREEAQTGMVTMDKATDGLNRTSQAIQSSRGNHRRAGPPRGRHRQDHRGDR